MMQIELTAEDEEAINRLMTLGFPRGAAIQVRSPMRHIHTLGTFCSATCVSWHERASDAAALSDPPTPGLPRVRQGRAPSAGKKPGLASPSWDSVPPRRPSWLISVNLRRPEALLCSVLSPQGTSRPIFSSTKGTTLSELTRGERTQAITPAPSCTHHMRNLIVARRGTGAVACCACWTKAFGVVAT